MVIEKRFVWLHFGKTAGTTTRQTLRGMFPESTGPTDDNPAKHANLADARSLGWPIPDDLPVAVGFRSLRYWAQSHLIQQFGSSIDERAKQDTVQGKLVISPESAALKLGLFKGVATLDDLLGYYIDGIAPHFIRAEYLRQDFQRFFESAGLIIDPDALNALEVRKNTRRDGLTHDIFSTAETAQLYASCPRWSEIEHRLYSSEFQPTTTT